MSRTYKTDPYWVLENRYGDIKHDHRTGACITGTALPYSANPEWKHQSICPRISYKKYLCDGRGCFSAYLLHSKAETEGTALLDPGCGDWHKKVIINNKINCPTCNIAAPTCTPSIGYHELHLNVVGTTPPRWYRKHMTHAPARTEARRALGAVRGQFNAGVRVDDDDFVEGDWEPRNLHPKGWWD